jgi:hypothetical protein
MKYNPLIGSDLAGHLGGIVASHNTYGIYLKRRAHPANPKTPAQIAQRTALQIVSQSWRTITSAQRLTWSTVAISKKSRKGFVVILTGQGAFMYLNLLRERIGLTLLELPPESVDPCTFTLPAVTLTAPSTLSVTYEGSDEWNASGGGVILSAGGPLSPGVSYWQRFRAVGTTPGIAASPVAYTLPFAVVATDRVRLRFHATDPTGRQSVPADLDVVAA